LTLDSRITQFKPHHAFLPRVIDVTHPEYDYDTALDELSDTGPMPPGGFDLPTKELVLGWTAEYVDIPVDSRLAARVEGKSSLARIGIGIHLTVPTIHAGFKGQIRLEIVNHGPAPIKLKTGMRICQLIFETTLGTAQTGYQGQFLDQEAAR
jgi:dCTP deaminase